MTPARALLPVSWLSAGVCAAAGLTYVIAPPPVGAQLSTRAFLTWLGVLGAGALGGIGLLVHWTQPGDRLIPLLALGALAGGFTFASLVGVQIPEMRPVALVLHLAGAVLGTLLVGTSLAVLLAERRGRASQAA